MIQRIVNGDFFTVVDRFGRFHTNLTNLKATLRPHLRYRESHICTLDIANSQPVIFCSLLINLLSNEEQLDNLIDYSFPETSNPYLLDIDQDYLDSLSSLAFDNQPEEAVEGGNSNSPILHTNNHNIDQNILQGNNLEQLINWQTYIDNQEVGEGGRSNTPIPHANNRNSEYNIMQGNDLHQLNNRRTFTNKQEGVERGERDSPILHANLSELQHNTQQDNRLGRVINRQTLPDDAIEFIALCERGVLYDDLMRRLGIPAQKRKGFKRLFFSQVFFGKIKTTGRVRELFARDFPTVYKAINDVKQKDYRQLAYLLQAHESKIMIDIICRKILNELPGTFIATIHDSIMTTPDRADEVKEIMLREFQRFGLNPTIRLEAY